MDVDAGVDLAITARLPLYELRAGAHEHPLKKMDSVRPCFKRDVGDGSVTVYFPVNGKRKERVCVLKAARPVLFDVMA